MSKEKNQSSIELSPDDFAIELVNEYGPTMSLTEVAQVLKRNRNALKSLVVKAEKDETEVDPWVVRLLECRCSSISNKDLFRTRKIASIL